MRKTTRQWRLAQLDILDRDRPAQRHARPLRAGHRHARDDLGAPGRAQLAARRARRPGRQAAGHRSQRTGRVSIPRRSSTRCPIEPASRRRPAGRRRRAPCRGRRVNDLTFVAADRAARAVCGLVPQRLHLPPAAGADGALGTLALPALAIARFARGKTSPSSAGSPFAGAAPGAAPPSRCSIRSIELVTGLIFAGGAWLYGPTLLLVARLSSPCAMVVLFMIDLQHRILPNVITLPGIVVGLAFSLVLPPGLRDALIGAVACSLMLFGMGELVSRVLGKDALGFGDVKMTAMMGAFLGWQLTLVALFLASFLGSVIGIGLVVAHARPRLPDSARLVSRDRRAGRGRRRRAAARLVRRAHVPAVVPSMNQQAFTLITMTALVAGLISVLVFAALRFAAAARDSRRHLSGARHGDGAAVAGARGRHHAAQGAGTGHGRPCRGLRAAQRPDRRQPDRRPGRHRPRRPRADRQPVQPPAARPGRWPARGHGARDAGRGVAADGGDRRVPARSAADRPARAGTGRLAHRRHAPWRDRLAAGQRDRRRRAA